MTPIARGFGGRRRDDVDPSGSRQDRGHPPRHEVEQARHEMEGRLGRHAAGRHRDRTGLGDAFADGDYTANMAVEDVTDWRA
jgi:hypothetical protein